MANFWRFLRPVFSASRVQHVSACILNSHEGHTMCGSVVDIQCATAEIRQGKKEERKKTEETTGRKYDGLTYYIGRP